MYWLMLILGLAVLTVGATWLTNGSVAVAERLRMSEYLIGLTIIAVGTSLPELASSIAATLKGHGGLALGNILGSNIANILLILGVCSIIEPLPVTDITKTDVAMLVGSSVAVLLSALVIGRRRITVYEGVAYIAIYAVYVWHLIK